MIAVTTSDDKSWKMWTIPDGQMIMRGDGHTDWVSGCDFHPRYSFSSHKFRSKANKK